MKAFNVLCKQTAYYLLLTYIIGKHQYKSEILVQKHSDIVLKCESNLSNPVVWFGPPDLTIYSDGLFINKMIPKFTRLSLEDSNFSRNANLIVKNFTETDQGLYQCHSSRNTRIVDVKFVVKMKRPPSNITILMETDRRIYCLENQTVILSCVVNPGIPKETMVWSHREKRLVSGGPHVLNYTLIATKSIHNEMFICSAQNEITTFPLQRSAHIFVYIFPTVKIEAQPSSTVEEGMVLNLLCKFNSSHPETTITLEYIPANEQRTVHLANFSFVKTNVSRHDAGIYTCEVTSPVGTAKDNVRVIIKYKPVVTRLGQEHVKYFTETGIPVKIQINVNSFETPTVSWISLNKHGKQGTWEVKNGKHLNAYILSSNVMPTKAEHFGNYVARIRNSRGREDISILILEDEHVVKVHPISLSCNASLSAEISCFIATTYHLMWNCSWEHYRHNTFIRRLTGNTTNNSSKLDIQFCDYQDTGVYVCTWSHEKRRLNASSTITVNSHPIVTKHQILENQTLVMFVVQFYSYHNNVRVTWFYHQMQERVKKVHQNVQNASILLLCYEKLVQVPGYEAILFIEKSNISFDDNYNCQIGNLFGTSELIFKESDITHVLHHKASTEILSTTDFTSMDHTNVSRTLSITSRPYVNTGKEQKHQTDETNIFRHILMTSGVTALVFLISGAVVFVFVRCWQQNRSTNNNDSIRNNPMVPVSTVECLQTVPESVYEEISSAYYLSVIPSTSDTDMVSDTETNTSVSAESIQLSSTNDSLHSYQDLQICVSDEHTYTCGKSNSLITEDE